ncbi:heterokaryon incompatibility protein [Colletotrichum kahawae]|uniref:Heterokaryon incompatibility protein n=1 Tax=Colletotrichum kahawae TaxID=34407 RepID=A0AAD9YN49_COLKA|nr:heterokaryon incompatibility protein [Colletotrichum kahawae]
MVSEFTASLSTFTTKEPRDNPVAVAGEVTDVPELSSDCCPEAFSLIRSWISLCLDRHPECRHTISGAFVDDINGPPLPTRVLDVGDVRNNHVRLLESRGRKGTFCALSYCWGTGEHNVKTTKDNYDQHVKSIKWGSMPQTFKDAIEITRETGVRYLWIDSLCIIQDDKSDWAAESSRMSAVYETAYLVIAASGASDPSEGCFSSKPRCPVAVEIPYESSSGTDGATVCISLRNPDNDRPAFGPLNQRGWALQETHLARRTVYYMPGGMCWKCKMLQCTERSNEDFEYYDDWDSILQQYSSQNLTIRTDRLPALQGLANAYQERSQDRYYIGIFGSDLPGHLLWMMECEQTEETFNWPTWSWASKEGSKVFMTTQVDTAVNISHPRICFDEESSALHILGPIASAKIGGTLTLDEQDTQDNPTLAPVLSLLYFTRRLPCQSIQSQQDTPEIIGVAAMDGSYSGAVSIALLSESSWDQVKSTPGVYYT